MALATDTIIINIINIQHTNNQHPLEAEDTVIRIVSESFDIYEIC